MMLLPLSCPRVGGWIFPDHVGEIKKLCLKRICLWDERVAVEAKSGFDCFLMSHDPIKATQEAQQQTRGSVEAAEAAEVAEAAKAAEAKKWH